MRWFEDGETATSDGRRLSQRDRDYVCGNQWTRAELDVLKARGQPDVTINYCSRKIELMCGLERKSRTDPKAFARNPADEDKADAATQALRYISDDNNFPLIRSDVYENMMVEGVGGAELGLEDDGKGGADITITQVPFDRLFWDPHSRRLDFSDARYKGIVIWMDRDEAYEMWPDAEDLISDTFQTRDGSYTDRPNEVVWCDSHARTYPRCAVSLARARRVVGRDIDPRRLPGRADEIAIPGSQGPLRMWSDHGQRARRPRE